MVRAFEKAIGKSIDYKIVNRRLGDFETCYADVTKAQKETNFMTTKTIDDMAKDAWNFRKNNPE